jgi:hypothetical protein
MKAVARSNRREDALRNSSESRLHTQVPVDSRKGAFRSEHDGKIRFYEPRTERAKSSRFITTYKELATAIGLVYTGDRRANDYRADNNADLDRLFLAQLLREKGLPCNVSDLANSSPSAIQGRLGAYRPDEPCTGSIAGNQPIISDGVSKRQDVRSFPHSLKGLRY